MTDSATISRVERRKQATATRVTAVCRRLTAERGLSGFTVEEACEEVGISRRTFFNYFRSKEEAVLGVDESEEFTHFAEQFLERGSHGWSAVFDDLLEQIAGFIAATGLDADEHFQLMQVIEREPRLLARFLGVSRDRENELVALVAVREGVPADDLRARASVDLVVSVLRTTAGRLSDPRVAEDFGAALTESADALRAVFPTTPRKAQK